MVIDVVTGHHCGGSHIRRTRAVVYVIFQAFSSTVYVEIVHCGVVHRSRIRYLSKKKSRILTNFPKL